MVGTYPPIQLGVLSPDILGAYDAPDPYGTATLFVAGEAFELPLGQIEDTFVPAWNGIEWGGVALTPDVDLRLRVRLTDGDLVNDDPIGTVVVDGIDIRAALDARQVVPVRVDDQGAPILLVAITVIEQ